MFYPSSILLIPSHILLVHSFFFLLYFSPLLIPLPSTLALILFCISRHSPRIIHICMRTLVCFLPNRLVGLVVRRPPREQNIPGSNPACTGIFAGSSHTSDLKIGTPWLPCQAPGVIGSALGLVGPVSVYCDWVRWKVWSATSISVWQHVKLSEQIRPWDTLACCWGVKQPTNKQLFSAEISTI